MKSSSLLREECIVALLPGYPVFPQDKRCNTLTLAWYTDRACPKLNLMSSPPVTKNLLSVFYILSHPVSTSNTLSQKSIHNPKLSFLFPVIYQLQATSFTSFFLIKTLFIYMRVRKRERANTSRGSGTGRGRRRR